MNIILKRNNSENNHIGKDLTTIATLEGSLKNESSIVDPVILVELSELTDFNYLEIPKFGRSYFVRDVISVRNNLAEIHCHVDVLESFQGEIKAQRAVIRRQENRWNLYLDDGIFRTYQNSDIITKIFPSGFSSQLEFVLAVAGGQ